MSLLLPQQCSEVMKVWMLPPVALVKHPLQRDGTSQELCVKGEKGFER